MFKRTEYCGLITENLLGRIISLRGWVHKRRDHGGIIFIDLRDREGIVQIICDPNFSRIFKLAEQIRNEFCLRVDGLVRSRPAGTENINLVSGKIEVLCQNLVILNYSIKLPFQIEDNNLSETTRLMHRVLDLRRPQMQNNLKLRHKVTMSVRNFLDGKGFIDIETPVLTKSTPEGARDYLVPSRLNAGHFFALPQSPQLFKQMLMVAGFDSYYQITKCFRDEDLRADRQPEFTQIDCEVSFLDEHEIRELFEEMICSIFFSTINVILPSPFPILKYKEAVQRFGSENPDLRIQLELTEFTDIMKNVNFKVFSNAANLKEGRVAALKVPNGSKISRNEINNYTEFVNIYGAKGLAWIKVNNKLAGRNGLQSSISKNISDFIIREIILRTKAENGDIIFFVADHYKIVNNALGALRIKIGHSEFAINNGLFKNSWQPLWIIDFPMFEYDTDSKRLVSMHHPFTSPKDEHLAYLESNPELCISKAYDMVLNGCEIGGGSVRIHQSDIQNKIFNILNINVQEANEKFGFLLNSLQYGAPPHGGIAFGLDRIVTMMAKADSIRDVIAFPKTQRAQDLLIQAPSLVNSEQLKELHIHVNNS